MVNRNDSRRKWLDAGLSVLAAEGAAGVRIERIAAKLKLSKGSFHHHFDGADGYKRELLAHFEELSIDALERAVEEVGEPASARAVLARLTQLVEPLESDIYQPELEVAVRAWASWDPDVRAVQGRIDKARLAVLQRVWRSAVATAEEARIRALLPYLVAVGASAVVPSVAPDDLRKVYDILLELVPDVAT